MPHDNVFRTIGRILVAVGQFLRESTPERRRQRYGDVDFDWDYRVDTTGATVGGWDRFRGLLHSPYQPTDPSLFHEMIQALNINFAEFMFIDLGSGKGRTLLMASSYPFRRIVGVELLPQLHRIAQDNISKYKHESQRCFALESVCMDAREFEYPLEPTVLYLFNPLREQGMAAVIAKLENSLREHPRPFYVVYHNPLLQQVFANSGLFRNVVDTRQYHIYESYPGAGQNLPGS